MAVIPASQPAVALERSTECLKHVRASECGQCRALPGLLPVAASPSARGSNDTIMHGDMAGHTLISSRDEATRLTTEMTFVLSD